EDTADGGDGDDGDGDDGDDDDDEDGVELGDVGDDSYLNPDDYPDATEEDFTDDDGNWSAADYDASAQRLFGSHEFFGDTIDTKLADEGYERYQDPRFNQTFDQIAPGMSNNVHLFQRDGHLSAFGFVSMAVLQMLASRFPFMDLKNLEVTTPQ